MLNRARIYVVFNAGMMASYFGQPCIEYQACSQDETYIEFRKVSEALERTGILT